MSMNHDTWNPSWVRGSKIEEIVWLSKDVLAWCSGVHLIFFNINNEKLSFRWCWNHDIGEGAHCLSTHSKFPVFAFAEKSIQPKIMIYDYPSMSKVSECIGGCPSGFLATAFTVYDYLVSVGFYPQFSMIVWNWRTGEKIIVVDTHIRDEVGQILRITQIGPTVIAQMGKTCGKLFTWELDVIGSTAVLKDHEVMLPKQAQIRWIDWSPTSMDPLLAIADTDGHIYLCNSDGSEVNRIVLSQRCGVCVDIELPMVNWFQDGIVLRTTFCQLRFYIRSFKKNTWQREWFVKLTNKPYILVMHPFRNERFFYYTIEGRLMQVDFIEKETSPRITNCLRYGGIYRYMDFVYPWCHHMAIIDDLKELLFLECYGGTIVSTIDTDIDGEITCQISHPDYPLIVLATSEGETIFISYVNPASPHIVASLRLQRERLDLLKFSYTGRFLIAAEKSSGNCYCINLHRDKVYTVQTLIRVQHEIADLLVYEIYRRLRVLVLYVGVGAYRVGQNLELFEVSENQNLITQVTLSLPLPGVYRNICYVPGNPTLFVGSPYLTRQLRIQKVQDFKDVVMVDGIATGHQVKLANLYVDRTWICSTALDGLVIVRDKTTRMHACIMTHHRADFGSSKAIVNRNGDLIVCLGYNGSLVATRSSAANKKENAATSIEKNLHGDYLYEKFKRKISSDYANLDATAIELLTRPKTVFPGPEDGDKTWSEWRDEVQLREETEKSKEEREAILRDFEALKAKVKNLLDENEAKPEIERLPVSAFDLDTAGRDQKLKAGRDECEDLRLRMEHDIREMKRVTSWLKTTFWDSQKVYGKSLVAIFGDKQVANYPMVEDEPYTKDRLEWATYCKNVMSTIVENETFRPWQLYSKEQLEMELSKRIKLHMEDERRIDLFLDDEEDEEKENIDKEERVEQIAMEGTTTHRFIEPSPYYSQLECYGFEHVITNNQFFKNDCQKLRIFFNRAFDEMYAIKERDMDVIRERIERIRYIDSELKSMFGQSVPCIPNDPKWHWKERPEGIIKVLDHEVKAKPYISPSQQEILDKQAAEAERIRQLLLADDFRERALMSMMDGVLEVRWEDIIKIDIPKPACMLQKKPENYTTEDVQAVKQYEKDVQFLQEERERYKRMLEAEYTRIMGLLQEGIDRFNGKLDDLFYLKMKVEAAIQQLNLRYVRGFMQIHRRTKLLKEEEELKERIAEKQKYEDSLKVDLNTFQRVHQQLLTEQSFSYKEKALVKKFKYEFASLSKLNVELLDRQYKRRPRTNLKNLRSSEFSKLAEHVLKKTPAAYLPSECKDYLKNLDHLDVRPSTLPPTIDSSHWDQLIRLRRQKIDIELKARAREAQIEEAEGVIFSFEQRIEKCRTQVVNVKKVIADKKKRRTISELDVELQLVLKMGQVEIDMNGDLADTEDAILVSQDEIEEVNKHIRAAGECKLKSLSRLLDFRRGTEMKEWEHECKRKEIEDLQEDLRFLETMPLTKEMQTYLKRKAKGLKDDKTEQQLEEHAEAIKQRFEKILAGHRDRLRSIEAEIESTRSKNKQLDRQILEMNVARCEMELNRDLIGEARQREHAEKKLRMIMKRAELIKKLQDNYAELLELQTEHELLRLRRYPTFDFKMLDDDDKKNDGEKKDRHDFCSC